MSRFLLYGKLTAKLGQREEPGNILIQASKSVTTAKGQEIEIPGGTGI
ncbi:MAG: hypothetical protein K9H16_09760 [Bacteroidales bacterium]|nr:hypothetical protein [Bacteroidales bacterium]